MAVRSNKLKFTDGERVLCYEPDPTKAKVLYDSKVLDVVINKDSRGKKTVEYLIHFQGWNSSWDRCVQEEFVLKDIPENRQLQRDLADQSQLQLGAYLYRRERKKHNRKGDDQRNNSINLSEDGSSCSPIQAMDIEESVFAQSSSEAESIVEDEILPIQLTDCLRSALEYDHYLINIKKKLHRLPAQPNIINILENYWKHYCSSLLCELTEKPNRRLNRTVLKVKPEDLQWNLNICKEMLDGLRIYFDFNLTELLLYNKEKGQVEVAYAKSVPHSLSIKQEVCTRNSVDDLEYAHLPNADLNDSANMYSNNNHIAQRTRRRSLRSNRTTDVQNTNGVIKDEPISPTKETHRTAGVSNSDAVSEGIGKILGWRLLPSYVYYQHPLPPSLVYGATHLIRLFVKMPELLNASGIMENKLKVLQEHLEALINYLSEHKEWYGDKFYQD